MEAASSDDDTSSSESSSSTEVGENISLRRASEESDSQPSGSENHSGSDDGSDSDTHEESVRDLPIAERVQISKSAGVDMSSRRKRRLDAVVVARQRLAELKEKRDDGSLPTGRSKRSKHAPAEVSSKRKDFYQRKPQLNDNGIGVTIGANVYKPRDPRMSNLCGHLNVDHFEHNFAFVQEIRDKEIDVLKRKVSARKVSGKKGQRLRQKLGITAQSSLEEDKEELKRLQIEKADFERQQMERHAKRAVKKKLHQGVASANGAVYFPKRKELKRMHMEAKFDELRKRGGDQAIQKAVAKRRKKNKSRDSGLLGGRSNA